MSNILQTQRVLASSANAIYAAFSDANRLAVWWGPDGFTSTTESFEFVVGGRWIFVMHGPNDVQFPNDCRFSALDPGRRIVIEHVSRPHFILSVSLTETDGGTLIEWVQSFDDAQTAAAIRPIAEPANEQNLDRLDRHLRGNL